MPIYFNEHNYSDGSLKPASHYFSYLIHIDKIKNDQDLAILQLIK